MQKKINFLFAFLLFLGFFLLFSSISVEDIYDYALSEQKIKLISTNSGDVFTSVDVSGGANTFVMAIPRDHTDSIDEILWRIDGVIYHRHIDDEGSDDTDSVYTFPLVTDVRHDIEVAIRGNRAQSIDVSIITTDTITSTAKLSFHIPFIQASDVVNIVKRSEWGADESLKYRSQSLVDQRISEWESRDKTPRIVQLSQSDVDVSNKESAIGKILQSLHPESFSVVKRTRYEGGNKLIWPNTYAGAVDRIIVHHTAESVAQSTEDDKVVLRSIYLYHTKTRGWGDIGYNYIIGKDGTVYEGRAGGDYVDGAHAYGNNLGTTGIALLGNFETNIVPSRQLQSLENMSVYLARKYGINVGEETVGFRRCGKGSSVDCVIEQMQVYKLDWHRSVGYTSCPGENLEVLLPGLRSRVASRVGNVGIVHNTINVGAIEPVPLEDQIKYIYPEVSPVKNTIQVASTGNNASVSLRAGVSYGGDRIKIKLSYPNLSSIDLSIASTGIPSIRIGDQRIFGNPIKYIKVGIVGSNQLSVNISDKVYTGTTIEYSAPVVRIDSWSRIPTWDTMKKYNDNLFRGKIILRNEGGKLLVVNELPLEDYLRGLGEVSNTDEKEKIKTITVAARSYARYYMDRKNRKYNTLLYDGSDDPDSFQKYLGYSYELRSPIVSAQVRLTRGQVITYGGDIIKAWYFSSSDGRTRSYREYCETNTGKICDDIPYLQSVDDPAGAGRTRAGHGVGISGIGATAMAQAGKSYKEIIQYYLKGVEIQKK